MIPYRETEYGYKWGSANVERLSSDEKNGWVVISIRTPKGEVQVYATKTGKLRVYKDNKELKGGAE